MTATILRADARRLPLPDGSVDLICTSPPYYALRSYTDGGAHYDGQIGAEPTPQQYINNLIACTREWARVLKPGGSMWINLGDKYARNGGVGRKERGSVVGDPGGRAAPRLPQVAPPSIPEKSLMLLPERYRIACVDQLGLIARAVIIWSKPNGLPESVTDRVRRSHEDWVHLTKQPRYYAAVDEIRTPHAGKPQRRLTPHFAGALGNQARDGGWKGQLRDEVTHDGNPLGALPGSVWEIPTEPLTVPAHLGVDHFAAYPTEWPRRIILGWSPSGICTACGEGRRPVVERDRRNTRPLLAGSAHFLAHQGDERRSYSRGETDATITGEACACTPSYLTGGDNADHLADWRPPPTRPSVVLDPFGGTGTTALVAHALGRHGITIDMSADYNRLAAWRTSDPDQLAKAMRVEKPPKQVNGQLGMFDLGGVV